MSLYWRPYDSQDNKTPEIVEENQNDPITQHHISFYDPQITNNKKCLDIRHHDSFQKIL